MNTTLNLVFFGSFQHYSAIILKSLIKDPEILVSAVITTPPSPTGRTNTLTKNPTHQLADKQKVPVFTPAKLDQKTLSSLICNPSSKPAFFLTAGYGKLIPPDWLSAPTFGSLNLHFSLLPKYRGANPAEWAILLGESLIGITLIEMAQEFDTGNIIAKKETPIDQSNSDPNRRDTRESLYQKLYELGAKELPAWLKRHHMWQQKKDFFCQKSLSPTPQPIKSPTPEARRFIRDHGYIHWSIIRSAMAGNPYNPALFTTHLKTAYHFLKLDRLKFSIQHLSFLERASRALEGYPSLWTYVPTSKGKKRLKIMSFTLKPKTSNLIPNLVQLEGLSPSYFNQIKNQILKKAPTQ